MAVRVNNNSTANRLRMNLRQAQARQEDVMGKLSSGKRVQRSVDDAAGLALATKFTATVRGLRQANRNANDGISFIQTAEGGLEEISNILVRLRELSIQSASDTVGESEREFLNKEYSQLITEVDRISEATSFNGTNVINGEKGELIFQVGAFSAEENMITFDTDNAHVDTSQIGIGSTSIDTQEDALDNLSSIDEAIQVVNGQRAELGASQNRLQHAANNIEVGIIGHDATRAKIEDLDVAQASAELASSQLLTQSAIKAVQIHNHFRPEIIKLIES